VATTIEAPTPAVSAEQERLAAAARRATRQKWVWRISGYVLVLAGWQFASGRLMDESLLPGPAEIARALGEIWESGRLVQSFSATLTRIGIGFALSFVIGSLIGMMTQAKWLEGFFRDATVVSLTAPGLVWALTGVIIWGFKPMGWIWAIVMATFALVTVNVSEGINALPKDLLDMAKSFGASNFDRQRHIVIPHLAPYIFNAIRFGFSIAWKVTVLTEVFASNEGIGFEMRVATQVFQLDKFLAWALAFFAFALVLEKVVLQYFERRFFRWRQEVVAS
jgi:NitT/TauT family transport system permease protein